MARYINVERHQNTYKINGRYEFISDVQKLFPCFTEGTYTVKITPGKKFWLTATRFQYRLDDIPCVLMDCSCGEPNCYAFAAKGGLNFCKCEFEKATKFKLEPGHTMQVDIELCKL